MVFIVVAGRLRKERRRDPEGEQQRRGGQVDGCEEGEERERERGRDGTEGYMQ